MAWERGWTALTRMIEASITEAVILGSGLPENFGNHR